MITVKGKDSTRPAVGVGKKSYIAELRNVSGNEQI